MINKAITIAQKSTDFRTRIGSVITDKRGYIISTGFNKRKTHPLQHKHSQLIGVDKVFLHAEISALVNCRQQPHTIYIARLKKDGTIGMAKPCPVCASAILESGIERIVYTENGGLVETIFV